MMNEKMTNKIALTTAIEVLAQDNQYDEVVEKLQKMLVQVEKKSSTLKKPTATQTENVALKEAILEYLTTAEPSTVSEIIKGCEAVSEMSLPKVTALVTQMSKDGTITREVIKRKAYFSVEKEA